MTKPESLLSKEEVFNAFSYNKAEGQIYWKNTDKRVRRLIGKPATKMHNTGYLLVKLKQQVLFVHRLIWLFETGEWPKHTIDHINGDRLDNRIENLRDVTNRENCQNKVRHRKGSLIGASYSPRDKSYRSFIMIGKKQIYLGYFKTEQEAHQAYMKKLKEAA